MASSELTPYQILDVLENIDYVTFHSAYRTKIHEHTQTKISDIKFRRICHTYDTLSDFNKHNHYDAEKE